MRYLSVCSGIEAATVAWHPLGWSPVAFAEIEKFPSAVLAHHYPSIPNLGDMTKFKDWPDAAIDVLVGGTPCQSFSVAGLRKGMADPRGNLALTYLAIADRYRPEWLLWENVPGVLSSSEGRDFGAFIGGLAELGYHASWRVLDAQYVRVDGFARAVPQRRRRVFVVGHLGDWRRPAAVLFERESLLGNTAPRRQAGERASVAVAPCLRAGGNATGGDRPYGTDVDTCDSLIASTGDISHCLNAGGMGRIDYETETMIAHALRAEGFDASEDGTGRGTPLVPINFQTRGSNVDFEQGLAATIGSNADRASGSAPCIAFDTTQITSKANRSRPHAGDPCHLLAAGAHAPAVAFQSSQSGVRIDDVHATLDSNNGSRRHNGVMEGWAVRRLTPRECERLQGFPDGYTAIPKAADGPRYKALGNSMAVNAMRWLGTRIQMVDGLSNIPQMRGPDGAA